MKPRPNDGGHFAAYTGDGFALAAQAARDWFTTHLHVTDYVSVHRNSTPRTTIF